LQTFIAPLHLRLHGHALDGLDAGECLNDETVAPVVEFSALGLPLLEGASGQQRYNRQDSNHCQRDQNHRTTDHKDQSKEDKQEWQVNK